MQAMIDSTSALQDGSLLRNRMAQEGYLYFSQLVDPARVLGVKADIVALPQEHHIIENGGATDPMWSGGPSPRRPSTLRAPWV